ncbi:glycosyltransferase family 4 protein [Paenibacillus sp. 19GGS1-52]|uniref:glycosyltransferase family 4 protein n=1 Tax=Paenibacillus sp. 19GGS1-52 TaxID=2758563 RepID=UPI001EFBBF14|nr:glycosyltransferase family 4 protein [Paenibacillus sp. 19GGS1-52]ULO07296.1 glycosyltransferase family 4 protein [Paenibacillus sp. 19GGS1-52]
MHICIIAPEQFPVPGDGSVEICIWAIARLLAHQHRVTIVSRRTPGLPDSNEQERVSIIRLPADSLSHYLTAVLNYIQGERFDVIQVDNRPLLMAAVKKQLPHTPVLLFLHSLTFVPPTATIAGNLSKADLVIANSHSLQQRLARRFPRLNPKISIVPLGVDLSRFVPTQAAEKLRLRRLYQLPPGFAVLFVGRVIPRKGVPVLIRAMQRLNSRLPAHLIIAGKGKAPYIRQLKLLARRLGVSVSFLGNVAHEEIHGLYQAADCFVCPSQRHESFGLVNVEAMATGLPVVASSNGGIKEIIISGHNGYLVKRYRESLPFARCLLRIGRNPKLAAKIGAQGRMDALQTFEWKHTAARLEILYLSLLPQSQSLS